jgi:alanyl-tRNA synthetase
VCPVSTRRLYYDDAYQTEFTARVMYCEVVPPDLGAGITGNAWSLVLDQTAFYPTSGGQPHDLGKIEEGNVLDVRDAGEEIIHIVDRKPAQPEVKCCLNWLRRFDHMQQHTGQHVLSAMFQERFGRPTVSFHLGEEACTIDVRGPEPSDEILEGAERAANQIVFEDRAVKVRYGTAEQFARLGVRKEVEREGILRAIEIEGVELQPCGGTHVKSAGQIGLILVRRCTKIRQDWRVEFVCGNRAEKAARRDGALLGRAAEKLSCATEDVVSCLERALAERDAHFKNYRALLERLAATEAALVLQSTPPGPHGLHIVWRVLDGVSPEYLELLATEVAKVEKSVAFLSEKKSGQLLFAQHPSSAKDMNATLKQVFEKFGGKGGGTRNFARGKLSDASQVENALALAREELSGA